MAQTMTIQQKMAQIQQKYSADRILILPDVNGTPYHVWYREDFFLHPQLYGVLIQNDKFFLWEKLVYKGDGPAGKKPPKKIDEKAEYAKHAKFPSNKAVKDVQFRISYWIIKANGGWGFGQMAPIIPVQDMKDMLHEANNRNFFT